MVTFFFAPNKSLFVLANQQKKTLGQKFHPKPPNGHDCHLPHHSFITKDSQYWQYWLHHKKVHGPQYSYPTIMLPFDYLLEAKMLFSIHSN
jgi:hypothetical protein